MSSLRDRVIAGLSAPPPETLDQGVLLWNGGFTHYRFFHVRDELVVAWNVRGTRPGGPPRPPIAPALAAAVARFLAAITPDELAATSPERPLRRFDEARLEGYPFPAFAIAHPSLAQLRVSEADPSLLAYVAFPCFGCEVADVMPADWARFQLTDGLVRPGPRAVSGGAIEGLFRVVYLWKLTGDYWKGRVKTVTLSPKPGPGAGKRFTFDY